MAALARRSGLFNDHLLAVDVAGSPGILLVSRLLLLLEHVVLDELLREGELPRVLLVLLV
jgi:hypothetical protein